MIRFVVMMRIMRQSDEDCDESGLVGGLEVRELEVKILVCCKCEWAWGWLACTRVIQAGGG